MHNKMFKFNLLYLIFLFETAVVFGFQYGQHFPQGNLAVEFIYGPKGTWKEMNPLQYEWNYYEQWATPNHPYDKQSLISAANGSAFFTARDANGFLLCDFDRDSEIDFEGSSCGYAFHEHSGLGVGGQLRGNPFTQFWLDDNWLARYMSQAYGRPEPSGLQDQPGKFMRWKVIGGDTIDWTPYNSDHFDTIALDGIYHLARGEVQQALQKWDQSLIKSKSHYNSSTRQYDYTDIHENYHVGLWTILTNFLMDDRTGHVSELKRSQILQHSVSLRSMLLKNQEKDGDSGDPMGWITNIGDTNTLMNTESVSCPVLGLGASAKYTFEVTADPMKISPDRNYFVRDYFVLSAVQGLSSVGHLSYGPDSEFPVGQYLVEFWLRMPTPIDDAVTLDIYESSTGQILTSTLVKANSLAVGENQWSRIGLSFEARAGQRYEFRTFWHGLNNVDVAIVRVK